MSTESDKILAERGQQWGNVIEIAEQNQALLACAVLCWVKALRLQAVVLRAQQFGWNATDEALALDCARDLVNYATLAERRIG